MLLEKVRANLFDYNLIKKDENLVLGVSGGADSLCMLNCMIQLSTEFNLKLYVVHINHMLRGNDADNDQEFVESFCRDKNIECFAYKINIENLAKSKNIGLEEAGREARYQKFLEVAKEVDAKKIIVAQNMNDQAETILFRMMRGSGLQGICGIYFDKAYKDLKIIRPLLNIKREEIEAYCLNENLNPRRDYTNFENVYSRNKVRLELIKYISENFNDNIIETLYRMGESLKEDNNFLAIKTDEIYNLCIEYKNADKIILKKSVFIAQHISIQKRILQRALFEISGDSNGIENRHLTYALEHIKGENGKFIDICKNIEMYNNYKTFEFAKKHKTIVEKVNDFCYNISLKNNIYIEELGINVYCEVKEVKSKNEIEKIINKLDKKTLGLDFDLINNNFYFIDSPLLLRNKRDGDKIFIGIGNKKLKDYFIDIKLDKRERAKVPLLVYNKEVLWVIGFRKTDKFKISLNTKRILIIQIQYKYE